MRHLPVLNVMSVRTVLNVSTNVMKMDNKSNGSDDCWASTPIIGRTADAGKKQNIGVKFLGNHTSHTAGRRRLIGRVCIFSPSVARTVRVAMSTQRRKLPEGHILAIA